jgi:hypothetical protein
LLAYGRLLSRPVTSFILDEVARITARCDGDLLMALVELGLIQATRPSGETGPNSQRSVSARAIGLSLGLSYETCRRKVLDLEAAGRCQRVSASRLRMSPEYLESPAYLADCDDKWRNLRGYLVELRETGLDLDMFSSISPQNAVTAPSRSMAINALIDDYLLRMQEARIADEEEAFNSLVNSAVSNMNGDLLRFDRDLNWKYAGVDVPPPDSARRPVTIAEVARRVKVSEDIIRGRVNMYVQRGWIRRVRGGYLHVMDKQLTPEAHQSRNTMNLRFFQLVQALRQLGVDPRTVTAD